MLPIINADLQSDFYVAQLKCILNYDNAAMIKEYLDEYFLHVPMSRYNWLLIAETYCRIKDFDKAQSAISNYSDIPLLMKKRPHIILLYRNYIRIKVIMIKLYMRLSNINTPSMVSILLSLVKTPKL